VELAPIILRLQRVNIVTACFVSKSRVRIISSPVPFKVSISRFVILPGGLYAVSLPEGLETFRTGKISIISP
jgi:hypothetical protein